MRNPCDLTSPSTASLVSFLWLGIGIAIGGASLPCKLPSQGMQRFPQGVNSRIEASISRGLEYLARSQTNDGSFRGATGYGTCNVAMTSLAGLAILGSGATTTRGRHWINVRRAANYLVKRATADGLITDEGEHRPMYGHGFATLFLSQVYGMEVDARFQRRLHSVLNKAVELTCRSQSREGGWYYWPESGREEGSVAITQLQALRACRNAGIVVPKKTIDRAIRYVHSLQNPDGGIAYSKSSRGSRPALSAAAVVVLYSAGKYDDPVAAKALDHAHRRLAVNGSGNHHHFYAQFYLAQALHQEDKERGRKYYAKMAKWLVRSQRKTGSWQGDSVGEIYGTAIALIILQLPYQFVPIFQR